MPNILLLTIKLILIECMVIVNKLVIDVFFFVMIGLRST